MGWYPRMKTFSGYLNSVGIGQDILGKIDQNRPGPSASGNIKGLLDGPAKVFDVFYQIVMFGAGPGDADNIGFLKGVVSDEQGSDLAGQNDDGDRVHEGRGDPGHRIGGPRSGGDQHHSHLSRGPGISVCRMDRGLFMANQDLADGGLVEFMER